MKKVKIVVASRVSEKNFFQKTATGRSLSLYKFPFLEVRLFPENKVGLPKIYNSVIEESRNDHCIIIFAHDDLHILDYYWIDQLLNGLNQFSILGIAGNKRRVPYQPSWAFIDIKLTPDSPENLSGILGHGQKFPPENLSFFGPPWQQVKLLDGLLMCSSSETLINNDLRFDERFDFHFYDMDFCRQAEQKNVSCGTWSLSLIHESDGNFRSEMWKKSYYRYIEKWGS